MNLQNLNLVELNAQEVQEVEGGLLPIVVCGVVIGWKAVAGVAAAAIFCAGAYVGYMEAHK